MHSGAVAAGTTGSTSLYTSLPETLFCRMHKSGVRLHVRDMAWFAHVQADPYLSASSHDASDTVHSPGSSDSDNITASSTALALLKIAVTFHGLD